MEKNKVDELKAAVYWIAVNYQQNFYEISSDWNKYNQDELLYLRNYIGYALYGPPQYEKVVEDDEDGVYIYDEPGASKLIDTIYDKILEHGTQLTDEKEVLCSILYTCVYDESSLPTCEIDRLQELVFVKPVFKLQKNIKKKNNVEFQTWYVDTDARVYKDWKDYLKNNNLPTCTMVAPKDGIYQADLKEIWSDKTSNVWVECLNINTTRKITSAVDVASTLVNVGCVGIGIAAIFNPISAPVAIAGAVGGAVSGVWGGGRAVGELVDRGTHDQSVLSKHAIPAWLGVAGSTLGLAASSGSALLSRAIRTGTSVSKSAQIAHDAIIISNLFVNSVGVGYTSIGMYQRYKETGEISARDVFFLTAHVLFICNSAVKTRLASDIIKSDQNQILKDYEDSLRSNRHRKEFRRLVRNTGNNIADEVHRNEQIIRSLTKINNRDEFFATMVQNRKLFASTDTQLSFADGQVQVNGMTLISPSTFAALPKDSIVTLINQASQSHDFANVQTSTNAAAGSTGRSLLTGNMLKSGLTTIRDFCVQRSVATSLPVESHTTEYTGILSDLQNIGGNSVILGLVLDTGLCIVKKIVAQGTYTEDDLLADATNFIWQLVKINFTNCIPGVNMYESKYRHMVMRVVEATRDYVKANSGEWANIFRNRFLNSSLKQDISDSSSTKNKSDSGNKCRDNEVRYNDIVMLDPIEVLALPKEVSTMIVQEALESTGSRMNEKAVGPTREMLKLADLELSDFFTKHPIPLRFKLADLPSELRGVLVDLQGFGKREILLYKLLAISMNIAQRLTDNEPLEMDAIVDVIKCLWIFVNMNFMEILPHVNMFSDEYEGFVMNIIIGLYWYQISEPDKWSSAFQQYRNKYREE